MSESKSNLVVCVTGASGFLGGWVMKLALERGWTVRATTRSASKHGDRLSNIAREAGGLDRLSIHECDLMTAGSFDEVVAGCDAVLHTASPFFINGFTEEHVAIAVEGTRNVMNAVSKSSTRKVALTSSTAAIYAWYGAHPVDHVMTESDWSFTDKCEEHGNWYPVSKTRAEKLAWEMAKAADIQLAVMNPCLILGPMLQPQLNTSSAAIMRYMNGESTEITNCTKCIVDVRDVALAHILAVERDAGWGDRHLLVGACPPWSEICASIKKHCPAELKASVPSTVSSTVPAPALGTNPPHPTLFECSNALNNLGMTSFVGTDEMVRGTVESLRDHGLLSSTSE